MAVAVSGAGIVTTNILRDTPRVAVLAPPDKTACFGRDFDPLVTLRDDADPQAIVALTQEISELDGVARTEVLTKEEAFEEFKLQYADRPEVWRGIAADAFPASIRVHVREGNDPETVAANIHHDLAIDSVLTKGDARTTEAGSPCPRFETKVVWRNLRAHRRPRFRPMTDTALIGSGTAREGRWTLNAYRATYDARPEGEAAALCLYPTYGRFEAWDFACAPGGVKAAPGAAAWDLHASIAGVFWGPVSKEVSRVELHQDDGTVVRGDVYPAPASLRLPFNFFVGFSTADASAVGTRIVMLDEGGHQVYERCIPAFASVRKPRCRG
jgi:hypothetical protein